MKNVAKCYTSQENDYIYMWKAKSMFDEKYADPALRYSFVASKGWVEKFMRS